MAVDSSGNLYALDPFRGTLQKFSNTGSFIASISSANGTALSTDDLAGIAIDDSNNVWVADHTHSRLIELDSSLNYVTTVATGAFVSVAAGAGHLYTLDITGGQYRVERFTGESMDKSKTFTAGSGFGDLAAPNTNLAIHDQIAADSGGTVYVTDADNQRVVELNSELEVLTPQLVGLTGYAQGIATGSVGGSTQVYVGDDTFSGGAFVRRFSPAGTQLGAISVSGAHGGLASDSSGNVFDGVGFAGGGVLRIDTTPDPAISVLPSNGLTSQTATFNAAAEIDLWGAADYRWDLDGSGAFATDTGTTPVVGRQFNEPGTYPVGLQITGTNGRIARTTMNYSVGNSNAAFMGPARALTNTAVTFDATPSVIPYASVADYAWDFDGSGSYAVDSGTSPTISHTFAMPGTYSVQLRLTRAGGRVDLASGTIIITPAPPPGPIGVSINGGDYATNSPQVQVNLVWPSAASQVMLSNDGGFGAAGRTMTRALAAQVPWTLAQTGPERLRRPSTFASWAAASTPRISPTTSSSTKPRRPCSPHSWLVARVPGQPRGGSPRPTATGSKLGRWTRSSVYARSRPRPGSRVARS